MLNSGKCNLNRVSIHMGAKAGISPVGPAAGCPGAGRIGAHRRDLVQGMGRCAGTGSDDRQHEP